MDSLKNFILVHKTTVEKFKQMEKEGFILGHKIRSKFKKYPKYLPKVKSKIPSDKKKVFLGFLSKEIKYDMDFLDNDDVLIYLDPRLLQDYPFFFNPYWVFGLEMVNSHTYEHQNDMNSKEELLYNLNKMNQLVISYIDSEESYFLNEVVVETDDIPLAKYFKGVYYK